MTEERATPFEGSEPESLSPADVTDDEIRSALTDPDPVVRQRGARVCAAFAKTDPEAARPFVGDLLDRLDDESLAVTRHAATALVLLSNSFPGDFTDDVDPVVDLARSDLGGIQSYAAHVLSNVAVEHPAVLGPHVDSILEPVLDSDGTYSVPEAEVDDIDGLSDGARKAIRHQNMAEGQTRVAARGTLAHVAVAAAEANPSAVSDSVAAFTPLLDDEDPGIVGAGLELYAAVAEADPDAVSGVVDDVAACLDHDDHVVRAKAIKALGFAGDDSVVERLRTVAEDDENEDVRDLATETADFLAQ